MSQEDIIYIGDQKRNIYFFDEDIDVLKKIGETILNEYPTYQVIACDNLEDIRHELIKDKPTVFILSITDSNIKDLLKFIKEVRSNLLIENTPIIVLGNRSTLETYSADLDKWNVSFVPKAIRIPYFMGVLSNAIAQAETVDVKVETLKAGQVLFNEGDKADKLYIVKSGLFQIFKHIDGDIFNIGEVKELEVIGEMSIVDKAPRSASARAIDESEVYILNIDNLESYLEVQPFWLKMILSAVINRLRITNDKLVNSN